MKGFALHCCHTEPLEFLIACPLEGLKIKYGIATVSY